MLAAAQTRPSHSQQLRLPDRRLRAAGRRPVAVSAGRGASGAPERPEGTVPWGGAVPLAGGGALWWQSLHSGGTRPVYGPLHDDTFVMQRPTVGGPGLIRLPRQPKPMRAPAPAPAAPPAVWVGPPAPGAITLAGSSVGSCSVVIDTDYVVLPPQQPAAVQPNTTCVGIVWQGSAEGEADAEASAAAARGRKRGRHPRRTQTLRFTCNLCGETNDCEVNPHAWAKGSVFARCQGCTAVHKLKDNLKIFHELAGPVFPPRNLRSAYLVQEILDRIAENNRN